MAEEWSDKYTESDYPKTHAFLNGTKGLNAKAFEKLTDNAKQINVELNKLIKEADSALKDAGASGYTLSSLDARWTPESVSNPTDVGWAEDGGKKLDSEYAAIIAEVENIQAIIGASAPPQLSDLANKLQFARDEWAQYIHMYEELQKAINADNPTSGDTLNRPGGIRDYGGIGSGTQQANAELERKNKARETVAKDIVSELDPNENYLGLSFRDQCYIQKNIWSLVTLRRGANFDKKKTLPYYNGAGNASIMCAGDPYGFMNMLTSNPSTFSLFNIPHSVLSNLQPVVRLFKVITNDSGEEDEIEITFQSSIGSDDVRDVFKNKRQRGFGVGLKSFEWSMEGTDPFTAKRMIVGKLAIHASNFGELLRDRPTKTVNGQKTSFKYADLAIKTGTTAMQELSPAVCSGEINEITVDPTYNLNFRLKMVVGYALPQNLDITGTDRLKYEKAVHDCFATYDLTPTIHEFNFEDDGRLQFIVNYQAYAEDFYDTTYFDIFASNSKDSMRLFELRMKKAFRTATNGAKSSEEIDDENEDDANAIRDLKEKNLKSLLATLFEKRKIYYYDIPYVELNRAMSSTGVLPVYDSNEQLKNEDQVRNEINNLKNKADSERNAAVQQQLKKEIQKLKDGLKKPSHLELQNSSRYNSDDYRKVGFFFLYDLIDIILENIEASLDLYPKLLGKMKPVLEAEKVKKKEMQALVKVKNNFSKFRVLLGPMEIRDPRSPKKYRHISMGEIPISVKYFSEWTADKMLGGDRYGYNLASFIQEFMKNFISVFMNDTSCGGIRAAQPSAFHSTTLTSYADSDLDEITQTLADGGNFAGPGALDMWVPAPGALGFLNTMGTRIAQGRNNLGPEPNRNWMIFYAGRTSPKEKMTGDRALDAIKGINHYILGQDAGLVKTINLEKTPAPYLKEMRFEQEGYDGLMQLREVYNANVDMFLLPSTYPGQIVFVDPRGFAPDSGAYTTITEDGTPKKVANVDRYELARYGIGGYYMIIKASHRIAEGEKSTQFIAQWLHAHEKSGEDESGSTPEDISKNNEMSFQKCRIRKVEQTGGSGSPAGGPNDVRSSPGASITANPNMVP